MDESDAAVAGTEGCSMSFRSAMFGFVVGFVFGAFSVLLVVMAINGPINL